ncbi:MAG: hypothetical protein J0L69_15905 [Bacteroidetes bacterium]|nr:hypothetical protein [Bacteroidota bacterium]
MNKLKKIISQLNKEQFKEFEESLKGTNSVKFSSLLQNYKEGTLSDEEIKEELKCTDNSYYVLKSRLYDKIQRFLLDHNTSVVQIGNESNVSNLSTYLYEHPVETAIAMLKELENKYINSDSPGELINVYSALKKANFYSDKYYHYSQLYNNQVAYALALEKAEETLCNFNRTLASYYFSAAPQDADLLQLLIKEIKNLYSLYKSPRIEIIYNIILIQSELFAKIEIEEAPPVEDLLKRSENIINLFTKDNRTGLYKPVINFLNFEYYFGLNQLKKASTYYKEIDVLFERWLLQNNLCLSFKFLLSKIDFLIAMNRKEEIGDSEKSVFYDGNDLHTHVIYKFYNGVSSYFSGKVKNSITLLNDLLNEVSFKNYFTVETEIKLTLAYLYILQDDIEMADNTLKGLSRKVASLGNDGLKNVKEAIKLMYLISDGLDKKNSLAKYKDTLEQLNYYNFKGRKILSFLQHELESLALTKRR